jgi:WD40 repeat protein/DNA-directed RNA polymerase subunit RPC12/RpoP
MSDVFPFDIFLSHNHADKPRVRRLAERLMAVGVRVWLDEWVIQAGDIIALKVDEGLEQSRVLLLCISPAALASGWVALERSTAVHRDPANAGRRFIPLLLSDCDLPDTLRRYKFVDFRQETEAAFDELLAACRVEARAAPGMSRPKPVASIWTALRAKKPANQLPAAKPKPRKVTPERVRPPEHGEPLAVLERKLTCHEEWVTGVAVSRDGTWAASGSHDKTVKIWDLENGQCRATLKGHTDEVQSVAITPNGKRILSGSNDGSIRVWDAVSGQEVAKLKGHTGGVRSVVALPDDDRALSGGFDKTLRLWDLASGKCLKTIECEPTGAGGVLCSSINPAGTQALSGHFDGQVRLWSLESGQSLSNLQGHSAPVNSVQITPNGRFAVSASEDKTIKVWDLEAETCVGTLEGHRAPVHGVAISPDGSLIASVTASNGDDINVWSWNSWVARTITFRSMDSGFPCVAFTPDGLHLLCGKWNGPIHMLRLNSLSVSPHSEPTSRYVNAKVVLLGEGTVGKTSLAHRLIEDQYVVKDRTHGMSVWPLPLPLPLDATVDREALLWDLAGQEDYRLIHRLFLDETALALLLLNPQKDDPFAEADDWLKALDTASQNDTSQRRAARLAVFSQVDVGEPKLSKAKLDRFCHDHGFVDWMITSAKNGRNCSDADNGGQPSKLKRLIADSIPWDKLPWTATPRLLAELKSALLAMRAATDIRLLRFGELAQRLEQTLPGAQFGESDVRTAVSLLANHGLARPLKFGDLVLLQPELLNGYAGAIIRSARAHKDEIGCVLEADIYDPRFDFTGVERLKHRPDEELLLRAMVQTFLDHSLCIAEDTPQGRHLVFPSQYRREKDLPHEPDQFVSYTFSGEWQTVWTTLVVRLWYSQEFAHRELWRNAAEFESARKQMLGLKIAKSGNGTATISLYFDHEVPDELKVIFIEYVHRHLARYACEVTRDRRYVCIQCGTPVKDLEAVRRRLEAKRDFITCQECDEKVPFLDFIEQRLKSDPIARKILAMDDTATRELDTQALEQVLIGHMMAIAGEANQIFRPVTMFDYGIDGEVEFKDNDGKASGKRIYIQLKSGNSYLRIRKGDGSEVFDVKDDRHLNYWISQPVDVYLVIRQTDEQSGQQVIRWMNVTSYLKARTEKKNLQIIFTGEKLDMEAVWKVRDGYFPAARARK